MNLLQRSLIEKTGYNFGFEYVLISNPDEVVIASARHPARATVKYADSLYEVEISSTQTTLLIDELRRSFSAFRFAKEKFLIHDQDGLAQLLRRSAALAHVLPNQAAMDYQQMLEKQLEELSSETKGTEIERLVRQRVGQQSYRSAMMNYWGGCCSVTGIAVPEVLRASHAKPWSECSTDNERLNVFNGFLLSANLDSLFDRFLITFCDSGNLLISSTINTQQCSLLGIDKPLKLRWIAENHLVYLQYHRKRFNQCSEQTNHN
ncbi:HNH endonuclease [Thalassolituus sp.]|jgi:hypothetical protein|uniref:HNH endonuclease n=1 Tax=Thalassolituus sp. TaxID=2030822 RepID=UPI0032D942E9